MSPLVPFLLAFLAGIGIQYFYPAAIHSSYLIWICISLLSASVAALTVIRKRFLLLDYRPCRLTALFLLFFFAYTYASIRTDADAEIIKNCEQQGYSKDTARIQEDTKNYADSIRSSFIKRLQEKGLTDRNLSLVNAIALGDRGSLSAEQKNAFRDTGTMHILVVSGMHVALIYFFFTTLFALFNLKSNKVVQILSIAFVWGYAILTGLAPSVCRASLMISFIVVLPIINARIERMDAVYLSLFSLLLYDPQLIASYSLWLSYISVYALLQSSWLIDTIVSRIPIKLARYILQLSLVSCVCQFATSPIILSFNEYFPTFFAVNNLVIVPLLSPLLILVIVLSVSPHCVAQILTPIVNWLTSSMDDYTQYAQTWHLSAIHLPGYTSAEIVSLSITVILLFSVIGTWKSHHKGICCASFCISCMAFVAITIFCDCQSEKRASEMIIWRRYDMTNITVYSDRCLTHFLEDTSETYSLRECARMRKEYRAISNDIKLRNTPFSVSTDTDTVFIDANGIVRTREDIIAIQLLEDRRIVIGL